MNQKRKTYCLDYLKARKKFRDFADKDNALRGNDNIVGRVGEAIAHSFLAQLGRRPMVNENQTVAGFDITCQDNDEQISVKMITSENKLGSTSKIRMPFDAFIGIELGSDLQVKRLGYITIESFRKGLKELNRIPEPNFSRSMFNSDNLFGMYGKVYEKDDLRKFDLL